MQQPIPARLSASLRLFFSLIFLSLLHGCGGGGGGSTPTSSNDTPTTYTVGGTISGLTGSLVLANNAKTLNVSSGSTSFVLNETFSAAQDYAISIQTQPSNQTCSISNGAGKVANANITNVTVTCATTAHALGGAIAGLSESGLQLANGSDKVDVTTSNASFVFPQGVAEGGDYSVRIARQPPNLSCQLETGSAKGKMGTDTVSNLKVSCVPAIFHKISGTFNGVPAGANIYLQLGDDTAAHVGKTLYGFFLPDSNGTFEMPQAVAEGEPYNLIVKGAKDYGLTCSIQNDVGVMATQDITNVDVTCSGISHAVSGIVTGLTTDGLILRANGALRINVAANASTFDFGKAFAENGWYSVYIEQQPSGQFCSLQNESGIISNTDINSVSISCQEAHDLIGTLSGSIDDSMVISVTADNATYTYNPSRGTNHISLGKILTGSNYQITTGINAKDLSCSVASGGAGTMGHSDMSNIAIQCQGAIAQSTHISELSNDVTIGYSQVISHTTLREYLNWAQLKVLYDDGTLNIYRTKNDLVITNDGHSTFDDVSSTPTNLTLNNFATNIKGISGYSATGAKLLASNGVLADVGDTGQIAIAGYANINKLAFRESSLLALSTTGKAIASYTGCNINGTGCLTNIADVYIAGSTPEPVRYGLYPASLHEKTSLFAITTTGTVYGWGYGAGVLGQGQLDTNGLVIEDDRASPALIPGLTGISKMTSDIDNFNFTSVFALKTNGTVYRWRTNAIAADQNKSYGTEFWAKANELVPTIISGLNNVKEISRNHALLNDGSIVPNMNDLSKTITGLPLIKHLSNEYLIDFNGRVYRLPLDPVTKTYYVVEVTHP
ncbi:hypothetical protein ACMYR3_05855 [Ampullimonas aquatilis]|uniref:hypothetical protein n=1 Tax=Ampullimonas aquatilis TaxID=1341549 RepID=UPI003C714CE9